MEDFLFGLFFTNSALFYFGGEGIFIAFLFDSSVAQYIFDFIDFLNTSIFIFSGNCKDTSVLRRFIPNYKLL